MTLVRPDRSRCGCGIEIFKGLKVGKLAIIWKVPGPAEPVGANIHGVAAREGLGGFARAGFLLSQLDSSSRMAVKVSP